MQRKGILGKCSNVYYMAKHILFVGDLRNTFNFGAEATTESMLSLLSQHYSEAEIKCIDIRSMQRATPIDGWDSLKEVAMPQKCDNGSVLLTCKQHIVDLLPYGMVVAHRTRKKREPVLAYTPTMDYHFPYKFADYVRWEHDFDEGKVLQYEKKLLNWADVVIINGEGNVVHGIDANGVYRRRTLYLFFIAWLSKTSLGKPTYMVNHVVDPDSPDAIEIIRHLYPMLDAVLVRDPLSLKKLQEYEIVNAEYIPDALFSYVPDDGQWIPTEELTKQIDFTKPYILVGDSSGFMNAYSRIQWNVGYYMEQLIWQLWKITPQIIFVDGFNGEHSGVNEAIEKTGIGYVNFLNCSWRDLYQVMKRAEIFISGRWHASILAILAGTPVLCWGADSHKTKALYPMLEYPYKFFNTATLPIHMEELVDEVRVIIRDRDVISDNCLKRVRILREMSHKNVTCMDAMM